MPLLARSDARLVYEATAGRRAAFRSIVERYQRMVFGVAFSVVTDRALAEDLAQETFLTAWRQLGDLREPDRLAGWLARIARNLAHDAIRRRHGRESAELGEATPASTPSPLDGAEAREAALLLQHLLQQLSEVYREPLVLFYLEGRSVRQVARDLGLGEDVVKQRLSRGRKALRAEAMHELEATLEAIGPRAGFAAAVLAAMPAPVSPGAASVPAAGKAVFAMGLKKTLVATGALGLAGGAVLLAVHSHGELGASQHAAAEAAARAPATHRAQPAPVAPGPTAVTTPPPRRVARRINPQERERLLGWIRAARKRREAQSATVPAKSGLPTGEVDKEVIRSAVREIMPLLKECYAASLERRPDLAGRVMVHFTIEGEPEVGGIITESEIQKADPGMDDPELLECLQETMYALRLDPPANGGVVVVTYPLTFASTPREAEDRPSAPSRQAEK